MERFSIGNKPKIRRTRPVSRAVDSERKVARSKLIDKSSDEDDGYQELCSKFNFYLGGEFKDEVQL